MVALSLGPWPTAGELDAQIGPIFGCATLSWVPGPRTFSWEPSDCDECWATLHYPPGYWVNYNYRCCFSCWEVISRQLWRFLTETMEVPDVPSNLIWAFLMEAGQH